MEMPINVIIVLFIALVVGGAIITFSQRSLLGAEESLRNRLGQEGFEGDDILDLQELTEESLLALADECIARNGATPGKETCFAIFAETFPNRTALHDLDNTSLDGRFVLNTSLVPQDFSALRLTFDPRGWVQVE